MSEENKKEVSPYKETETPVYAETEVKSPEYGTKVPAPAKVSEEEKPKPVNNEGKK